MNAQLDPAYKGLVLLKYKKLLVSFTGGLNKEDKSLLKRAFLIALSNYGFKQHSNEESYFSHSVDVAGIISANMGLGLSSVVAALLARVDEKLPEVNELFNHERLYDCRTIIRNLDKISKLPTEKLPQNSENFVSLLLSLSSDVRVVLIKLADRLQYMRNIQSLSPEVQKLVSVETSNLYAPLAHRLGLYKIKSELDELSLHFSKPEVYNDLVEKIRNEETRSRNYLNRFIEPIKAELNRLNLKFTIKNRVKSVSSVYSKIKKQNIDFEEVFDLFAIRIILESSAEMEKSDCWKAYSVVTNLYTPETSRMRDWITIPRPNGYESLHITVSGPDDRWVEVQIRTKRMDEEAEMGNAAHWRYKGQKGAKDNTEWLNNIRKILENPADSEEALSSGSGVQAPDNQIYVFTPEGDVKKLRSGSTLLDFAFEVHTNIGSKCSGGRVNGKNVPIRHVLKSGDLVEVMTSKNQNPNIDWLGWVVTSRAKNKIKRYLKEAEFAHAEAGKAIFKRKLSQIKNIDHEEALAKLISHFKLSGPLDLYQRLADERIEPKQIKEVLNLKEKEQEAKPLSNRPVKGSDAGLSGKTSENTIIVNEHSEIDGYKLARCCNPVMGDEIFGFITVSDGIKIHRTSCPNASRMRTRYPYRSMDAKWSNQVEGSFFIATVKISGFDQLGILNTITNMISQELKMDVRGISLDSKGGKFDGIVKVSIRDKKHLEFLIKKLLSIKGVIKASRLSSSSH